ncbi:MAG: WD40/YVTN/BNR-like repeat-containing protein [Saprospiraceae bacterium]
MPRILLTALLCLLFQIANTQADLSLFKYRDLGPARGGRVTTVAGVASQPNVFYMGATGGGVWKTTDYGTSWNNISDGFFATPSIGAIRVAPSDPNIIYVGTGSDGMRSNIIKGKGVYKSIDAGQTWKQIGLKNTGQIGAVEVHPTDHNVAFVAAIGQPFKANKERGIYRTKDGGQTWQQVFSVSETTGFVDLEFMPSNPQIIYATAWTTVRRPWTIVSGGKECGIYKSIDGGDTWKRVGEGLPKLMGKIDLAVTPADSKLLYALVEAPDKEAGLYRSEDHGATFKHISYHESLLFRAFYFTNLTADPQDANTVYSTGIRFMRSKDGGENWTRIPTPHGDDHDLWINPNNSQLMIEANDGGANVSHNGGKTWSSQLNQTTSELYQVEVDNQHPYWLYAGQQDNYTTISVPSQMPYSHQAGSVGLVMNTGGCETGPAVPNPANSDIVYSNCKGRFSVFNKKTGQEKRYDVGARYMYGHNPKDLKFRFQRVSPIHVSPHDPQVVYHASQYLHRTTDEGKTWEIISPDLTAFEADKQVISGTPISRDITGEEFYSTIYSVQESTIEKGLIWVGSNDGPVHVTRDGGKNWQNVTPKGLPKGGRVDAVAPSPHDPAKAYVSVLLYQLGDDAPYIYKTENYGKTWTQIVNGIPADSPVRVVREDPNRKGLLYAGTEYGMFISFNDGQNWQSFQQNLPVTPITDLKIKDGDLVLSTMGRGFQILDDLSPLYQQYDQVAKADFKLFQPRDTYRYRTSRSSSDGVISYPRAAVNIFYQLPEKADSTLRLEIVNAEGKVVRAYTNQAASKAKEQFDMSTNETAYSVASQLKTTAGLHRFRWDMRHAGAWDVDSKKAYRGGFMASPGQYKVRLISGGQTQEQSFNLLIDPRVEASGVTLADIKTQEKTALEIIDLLSAAKRKAAKVEDSMLQVGSSNFKTLKATQEKLITADGSYQQPMLIGQIGYLYGVIRGRDQAVGEDVKVRLMELKAELEQISVD